jgi:hypothetical protein
VDKQILKTLNPNLMVTSGSPTVQEMNAEINIFSHSYPQAKQGVLAGAILVIERPEKQKGGRPEDPPPKS